MKNFFQMDGPVMRAMSDLSTLVILNLVTMLCCLPVVTAGASLSAMHYILMQMVGLHELLELLVLSEIGPVGVEPGFEIHGIPFST